MTELIADGSKPLRFHWTDVKGNRWWTEKGCFRETHQAQEIANRVRELIYGAGPMATQEERDFYTLARSIALEVLLRDQSNRLEGTTP